MTTRPSVGPPGHPPNVTVHPTMKTPYRDQLLGRTSRYAISIARAHPDATRVKVMNGHKFIRWAGYAGTTVGTVLGFTAGVVGGMGVASLIMWAVSG